MQARSVDDGVMNQHRDAAKRPKAGPATQTGADSPLTVLADWTPQSHVYADSRSLSLAPWTSWTV